MEKRFQEFWANYITTSFTRRNIRRSRLSIVDNIANFKIQLIDGAETVSTVLNNSKIRFRKLPVILITF
jgi:phosphoribulokinase